MTRLFDVLLSILGLLLGAPLLLFLFALGFLDTGSPLFFQARVGRDRRLFTLVKFRTMKPDTAHVATHLADVSAVTRWGAFLRRVKFDELPQLWNVLKGEMSLVGPRPCLPTQTELIAERARRGVFSARPGVTGLAQVRGIDMSDPARLAEVDAQMLQELSVGTYFRYLFLTASGRGMGDRVRREKSG
ncbi:MAG: sugar transferase [Zoogloeaceae bacterium]|jgi:lipopolysaccharide/colanic/teichoic acid biosynthesis glycosyltransferase|nr:sugar transferase [Zoogloeaceae bacterium]